MTKKTDVSIKPIQRDAEIPSKPGEKPQYMPGFGAKKTRSKIVRTISVIVMLVFLVFFIFYIVGVADNQNKNKSSGQDSTSDNSAINEGYCSSNQDCYNFGIRNCGGYNMVLCDESDRMCHCCLSLNGHRCITCAEAGAGCSGDKYCLRGACVFNIGGLTNQ